MGRNTEEPQFLSHFKNNKLKFMVAGEAFPKYQISLCQPDRRAYARSSAERYRQVNGGAGFGAQDVPIDHSQQKVKASAAKWKGVLLVSLGSVRSEATQEAIIGSSVPTIISGIQLYIPSSPAYARQRLLNARDYPTDRGLAHANESLIVLANQSFTELRNNSSLLTSFRLVCSRVMHLGQQSRSGRRGMSYTK
jgi:hypothetical protein